MMKLQTALAVVLSCACPLLAQVQGTIAAPNVVLPAGQSATIDITLTGPVSLPGYNLNLQIGDGAWDQDLFGVHYSGGPVFLGADPDGPGTLFNRQGGPFIVVLVTPQMLWAGYDTFRPDFHFPPSIQVPAGETRVLARVMIDARLEPGVWPMSLTSLNGPSDYAHPELTTYPVLVDGSITVVPEPASLVLLLTAGGLALQRRR